MDMELITPIGPFFIIYILFFAILVGAIFYSLFKFIVLRCGIAGREKKYFSIFFGSLYLLLLIIFFLIMVMKIYGGF